MDPKLFQKLAIIQARLKVPKNQRNKFGGYNYRSAEDIMTAVKPLLIEHKAAIYVSDEIIVLGPSDGTYTDTDIKSKLYGQEVKYAQHFYCRASATFVDTETGASLTVTANAREPEVKKGMDEAQITGACSSYARKYALNGLLLIDDTKDADFYNQHGKDQPAAAGTVGKGKQFFGKAKEDAMRAAMEDDDPALENLVEPEF